MTDTQFMKRKNEIIERHTGRILIPEDQLKETGEKQQYLSIISDDRSCPYCTYFLDAGCFNCPMGKAGNRCGMSDSTYDLIINRERDSRDKSPLTIHAITGVNEPWHDELQELVTEYNREVENA